MTTELNLGIRADVCANGETWEFSATLDGHRVGTSIFRTIRPAGRPTLTEQFEALQEIICKPPTKKEA